jgi:hypothetical protein
LILYSRCEGAGSKRTNSHDRSQVDSDYRKQFLIITDNKYTKRELGEEVNLLGCDIAEGGTLLGKNMNILHGNHINDFMYR